MGNYNKIKESKKNKTNELSNEEYIKSKLKNQNLDRLKPGELTPKPYDENRARWNANNKIVDLYSKNASKDRDLKDKYAKSLIRILVIQLIITYIIFGLAGAGIFKYDKYVLNIFITGSLLETFAVIKTVVENLFNNNLSDSLNIILKNSNSTSSDKKEDDN